MKTSRYDFTMPASLPGSRSSTGKDKHDKAYYYYYVYRKKIDPNSISGPDDLPIPKHFRRDKLNIDGITGSLPRLNHYGSAGNSRSSSRSGTPKRDRTVTIGKTHRRSNSLPELKNVRTSPKNRRNDYPKLKPLKGGKKGFSAPQQRTSRALPGIKRKGNESASSSTDSSSSGISLVRHPRAMSLFNLKPEDGLQWSRHTTISKGPNGR